MHSKNILCFVHDVNTIFVEDAAAYWINIQLNFLNNLSLVSQPGPYSSDNQMSCENVNLCKDPKNQKCLRFIQKYPRSQEE